MTREELAKLRSQVSFWLRRWYRSPLAYVIEHIGDVPTHQQAEILKAFEHHNFVAVKSGHGIGKSKLTGWLVNWWLDTRGKVCPITGAGGEQLYDVVWSQVCTTNAKKWKWISDQYEKTSEELRLKSNREIAKAKLRVARADNDDALQGFHDCMFFIDEASGVRDGIFEVASGAMGDPGAFGFMDGNPTRLSGYMYNVFHKRTRWYTLSFSSENSLSDVDYRYSYVDPLGRIKWITTKGRQTRQWLEDMKTEFGENSNTYRVRVLGEFANLGRDQVVEARWLENVYDRPPREDMEKKCKRRMGIDPAWTGEDDTAVVIREGNDILHVEAWHGFDTVESFQRAKALFDEWNCDYVHIDTIGVGAGVYDNFRHMEYRGKLGYPAIRVHCSENAPEDIDGKCMKLRDWLWWKARKYFRTKPVRFCGKVDDPVWRQLREELMAPTYKISEGKIKVESKDEMKKRGHRSPNIADALNTTFYQDYELFRESYRSNADLRGKYGKKRKKAQVGWKGR